jgi:plastocyanin
MRLRNVWVCALGLSLAVSVVACGGGSSTSSSSAPASGSAAAPAGAMKVDAATAGNITGVVTLDGTAPKNEAIKMNADPVCQKANTTPQVQETFNVGSDGKSLANTFVYVKDGLGKYVFDAPTDTVKIDQKDCRYHPHVFGLRVGQTLEISNSDPTLHNIHALPKGNAEFNTAQPIQNMKTNHTFDKAEVMVPFKCEVHGWMNAYVGVVDNPYFAVTGEDGKFSLKGVPAGTYTVEAWHEKLEPMTQSVTIAASESKDVTFTFKAPAAATN